MEHEKPNANSELPGEVEHYRKIVRQQGLCGLVNNVKWDEFLTHFRKLEGWTPQYRYQCLDGPPSRWDGEWYYHVPLPMISVSWFELRRFQETKSALPDIDHADDLTTVLQKIGLNFAIGRKAIRIFAYSPKNYEGFEKSS